MSNSLPLPDEGGALHKVVIKVGAEVKVLVTTLIALLGGQVVAALNAVTAESTLLGGLHPVVQYVVLSAIPPLVNYLGGYLAPHTKRPDLGRDS